MKIYWVSGDELQGYLDKFGDKIKFMMFCTQYVPGLEVNKFMLVIDESKDPKSESSEATSLNFSELTKGKL